MDISLENYVFCHYKHFLTRAEAHAWRYLIEIEKMTSAEQGILPLEKGHPAHEHPGIKSWQKNIVQSCAEAAEEQRREAAKDPVIRKLIEEYREDFYIAVTHRVLRDHPDAVRLNLCPKCLNLCRTPEARLCVRCGYSWHSKAAG